MQKRGSLARLEPATRKTGKPANAGSILRHHGRRKRRALLAEKQKRQTETASQSLRQRNAARTNRPPAQRIHPGRPYLHHHKQRLHGPDPCALLPAPARKHHRRTVQARYGAMRRARGGNRQGKSENRRPGHTRPPLRPFHLQPQRHAQRLQNLHGMRAETERSGDCRHHPLASKSRLRVHRMRRHPRPAKRSPSRHPLP